MLPGAVPPTRKQEPAAEATFDKPASVKTLDSSGKVCICLFCEQKPQTFGHQDSCFCVIQNQHRVK